MEGWIKLHRKMLDNDVVSRDAETLSIWVYLLLNATHKETPASFKGKKIVLKPGQLITGTISISKKLLINKDKVQRTLKCFELNKQIEQQTSNKNRLISILNWSLYQNADKQIDNQLINKCETNDKQLDNKQEDKEDKNIYFILFNKYKRTQKGNFAEYMRAVREMKKDAQWDLLTEDEQTRIISEV